METDGGDDSETGSVIEGEGKEKSGTSINANLTLDFTDKVESNNNAEHNFAGSFIPVSTSYCHFHYDNLLYPITLLLFLCQYPPINVGYITKKNAFTTCQKT